MPIDEQWLQEALEKIETAVGEVVLDFSSVRRVDAGALRAMERVAGTAGGKSVKVILRGVNIDVYKALTLMKLAPRFGYQN